MVTFNIENAHDETINAENILAVVSDKNLENSKSYLIGNVSEDDILDMIGYAIATGLKTLLKCDEEDLKVRDFSKSSSLMQRIEAFDRAFEVLKADAFMNTFEDAISIAMNQSNNIYELLEEIKNSSASNYLKFTSAKIDINEIKKNAKEVLGAKSEDDIQIDIEELIKQLNESL